MAIERMDVKASDNEYLHKDFHGALSTGIDFLARKYGADAVKEYLRDFVYAYMKPLTEQVKVHGLSAIKDYYENIYSIEGGVAEFNLTDNELIIKVKKNPAVKHMRENNYAVAENWIETIRTVNEAICDGTEYKADLLEYDNESGANVQLFSKK